MSPMHKLFITIGVVAALVVILDFNPLRPA